MAAITRPCCRPCSPSCPKKAFTLARATEDRRAQLLEVGLELYAARGFQEVPIDEIATAAGVSKGLLYHYFEGKRGYFVAVVEHAADLVLTTLQPDFRLSPAERALRGLRRYLELVSTRKEVYLALMRGAAAGGDPEVLAQVERVRAAVIARTLEQIGVEPGRPAFDYALRCWLAAVEAGVTLWLEGIALPEEGMVHLFALQLKAAIQGAIALDPEARIDFEALPQLQPEG